MGVNRLTAVLESPPLLPQLSVPSGANSFEQVKNRMAQEAILSERAPIVNAGVHLLSDARFIELRHLIGALLGNPNGKVRGYLNEAMRTLGMTENEVREKLGLGEYDSTTPVRGRILQNDRVQGVFILTAVIAKERKKTRPETEDILTAILVHLGDDKNWRISELTNQANSLIDYIVNSDSLDALF